MSLLRGTLIRFIPGYFLLMVALALQAQGGNAGTIHGTVTDHSGAVIPNATVQLSNQVSGLESNRDQQCNWPIRIFKCSLQLLPNHCHCSRVFQARAER